MMESDPTAQSRIGETSRHIAPGSNLRRKQSCDRSLDRIYVEGFFNELRRALGQRISLDETTLRSRARDDRRRWMNLTYLAAKFGPGKTGEKKINNI